MPRVNIEIMGMAPMNAKELKEKIFKRICLLNCKLNKEVVISVIDSHVENSEAFYRPFLRIYDSEDHRSELSFLLEMFKMDIEFILLREFVPKSAD